METNMYNNGVRAEPKFLRDPTSFESLSSGISRLSSYVASNLPKRKTSITSAFDPHYHQYQQQQQQQQQQQRMMEAPVFDDAGGVEDDLEEEADIITFSSFEKLDYENGVSISCLLLGYHDGFQLWDITNPDNVHEVYSIRDKDRFGTVSFMHILNDKKNATLAIVSETAVNDNDPIPPKNNNDIPPQPSSYHSRRNSSNTVTKSSHLIIYSLKSQSIVKEIHDFGDEEDDSTIVTCIKSNHKVIALATVSRHRASIHLLSTADYKPFASPLTDIYHDHNQGPIFTLGPRLIAYATNAAVLNSDPAMSSLTNKGISYSVLQGDKDVKGAAKDIAKEVVSGMKTLGEFGLNTLSNYFGNTQQIQQYQQQQQQQQHLPDKTMYSSSPSSTSSMNQRRLSANSPRHQDNIYSSTSSPSSTVKKMMPSGMIIIRDILKLPTTPTRNLSLSTIAHFRPHTHPISCLTFNEAGTLLMSASKQGHTFHIFTILTNVSTMGNASHLYSLSRGITDAQVVDCQFSIDSTWCAITTARGTTHVYAINPYGGKPEISGHVHGKVHNPIYHPFMTKTRPKATNLNSVVRIKQRRKIPGSLSSSHDDLGKYMNQQQQMQQTADGYTNSYYGPTPPHYTASAMHPIFSGRVTNKEPRAKITTMFVTATRSPYLVNNSVYKNKHPSSHTSLSSHSDSPGYGSINPLVGSIKQQATNMLSSFGSSMSNISYLPNQQLQQQHTKKWDKNNTGDTLMFGFDEEYDDSTKIINDEIGYQDLYSFHPDGILTLHRCWVAKTVVKRRENGRNFEKVDLSVKEEDVVEWRVARNANWDQVRLTAVTQNSADQPSSDDSDQKTEQQQLSAVHGKKKTKKQQAKRQQQQQHFAATLEKPKSNKKLWLSNAEISTYANLPDDPALWTYHQFSFQTYQDTKDLDRLLHAGIIPKTDTIIMLKGMPEPVSSRIDRVRKTTTHISNDNVEENMEDALAELEDNISKAMETSFSPSSHSLGNSPATNKWLSSSANAVPSPSPSSVHKSFTDRNSSLSFEDAYLINMGSGPSPEQLMPGLTNQQQPLQDNHMQNSSLIQFDDDESDAEEETNNKRYTVHSKDEQVKPDGDNEVAYPYDSVFGEFRHLHPSDENSEDDETDQQRLDRSYGV